MDGSPGHRCRGDLRRRDLAAIRLDQGSLGGGQRVARRDHAAPRRDRNDGDVAAPRVGAVRVGRGERVERSYGRGAVTSDGATRLVERASVCAAPSFFPAPRPRYPQERKILSLMNPLVFLFGGAYVGTMYGPRAACRVARLCVTRW